MVDGGASFLKIKDPGPVIIGIGIPVPVISILLQNTCKV